MTLHPNIATVLEYPNSIAIEASQRRQELALQAEALESALEAAVAGDASNSLERMLCHQLSAGPLRDYAMNRVASPSTAAVSV